MSAALKAVDAPVVDRFHLKLPAGFDPYVPDVMPGLPEETRISERARNWIKMKCIGLDPDTFWMGVKQTNSLLSADQLLAQVLTENDNPWIGDRDPTIPLRVLACEEGRAALHAHGAPNLFLADKKMDLAINICRIHDLHVVSHWDVSITKVHDRTGVCYANAHVFYPEGDH
jgi:hypothetical protein